jgi:hypothetical protein
MQASGTFTTFNITCKQNCTHINEVRISGKKMCYVSATFNILANEGTFISVIKLFVVPIFPEIFEL